jgi:cytochrome c oxidase assembly protein subunit 15
MQQKLKQLYPRISVITISAVYLLILVGGIVRSTGAGMGCPDWPKCFGQYIPPTSVSELPVDYKEQYSQIRLEKNIRLSGMFSRMGMAELAYKITNDKSVLQEGDFNATKTWIEYVNRLIGAVIGLLIFATVVSGFSYFKDRPVVFWISFSAFILVGFQGWVGSIVVSTNLLPGIITFHMLLALVIVALLIYAYQSSQEHSVFFKTNIDSGLLSKVLIISMILYLIQVGIGTQVRELVDQVAASLGQNARGLWIDELGVTFYIHRSYSLVILVLHIYMAYIMIRKMGLQNKDMILIKTIVLLIGLEILTGALMAYFAIPAILQPVHLVVASLIFGLQFYMFCILTFRPNLQPKVA